MDKTYTLRAQMEGLPQEIYDIIKDHVFTIAPPELHHCRLRSCSPTIGWSPKTSIYINKKYTPPKCLQINQVTRKENIEDYYRMHLFICKDLVTAISFLDSIGKDFRSMLGTIGIGCYYIGRKDAIRDMQTDFRRIYGDSLTTPYFFLHREEVEETKNAYW